jgi:hypothetical protein
MPDIYEEVVGAFDAIRGHIPHHAQPAASPQDHPQETHMSKLANALDAVNHAQAQLAAIPANALAEAIADAGLGQSFTPADIGLVVAMVRAIEHGPGLVAGTPPQQPMPPAQPGAADLTPQPTA